MNHPTPIWRNDHWTLDLRRPWQLGRHTLDAPPPPAGLPLAIHLAWSLLTELRATEPLRRVQEVLPGIAGPTVGQALAGFLEYRTAISLWGTKAGEKNGRDCIKRLTRELGCKPISAFAPPSGTRLLVEYRDLCRKGDATHPPIAASRMAALFCILRQALRWAAHPDRALLAAVPEFPTPRMFPGEPVNPSLDRWIDEPTFRAVRAALYTGPGSIPHLAGSHHIPRTAAFDLAARRRLYLSFGFYTGMRTHDLDCLTAGSLSPDLKRYLCYSRKTGAPPIALNCPAPLLADLQDERERLGRPYHPGEEIAGGPWPRHCAEAIAKAARSLGLPAFDRRDLRRSFAWHQAAAGVQEGDLQRMMRHKDSRMLRKVYEQHLPAAHADAVSGRWPKMTTSLPGTGPARVIPFRRP